MFRNPLTFISFLTGLILATSTPTSQTELLEDGYQSLKPGFRPHPEGEPTPISGYYKVALKKYVNEKADPTNQHITVFYPVDYDIESTPKFRFLPYMHGFGGGGIQTVPAYYEICKGLASFGYVVALPHACDVGCVSDGDILGFEHYYEEQYKTIDWAAEVIRGGVETPFTNIDFDAGIGIVGKWGFVLDLFSITHTYLGNRSTTPQKE